MSEFDEIRPYQEGEMKEAFEALISDRQFNAIMKGFAPWLPKGVRNGLLRLAFMGIKTPLDFQLRFMKPVVKHIMRKHTDGTTFDDTNLECRTESVEFATATDRSTDSTAVANSKLYTLHSKLEQRYTFVSNHRDIVLDSAFLDVLLINHGHPTTVEIGIGDNLLIYPWIKRLVRMNKAFTVRRGLTAHEMMQSSQLMSSYIHYAVTQKRENIWIAQREGRAKDSDDRTQESVLKMLAMGGEGADFVEKLRDLNIVPLTISYEYDPCDYLKAKEFQLKRDNPAYKKSKQDDLDNMKTGIFGYKGKVHYHCGTPVNNWIDELKGLPKNEFFKELATRMDKEIHAGYMLFPANYLAYDMLNGNEKASNQYLSGKYNIGAEKKRFEKYLGEQIAKIDIPDKDTDFLRERILTMYANPLRNYWAANGIKEP
jgi:hypothetical protein